MTIGKLPPKPDPATGLPRPPAAPLDGSWGSGHRGPTDRTSTRPDSPPGHGPALEWTTRSWGAFLGGLALTLAILIGFFTLKDRGFGWMLEWKLWLIVLIFAAFGALFVVWTQGGLAAGADWIRDGKVWVKTYELTEVKLGQPRAKSILLLKDADGRELTMDLMSLQTIPALWDLVYNGMLHSAHSGATVNERAREELWLDPQLHLIHDDDPRGDL